MGACGRACELPTRRTRPDRYEPPAMIKTFVFRPYVAIVLLEVARQSGDAVLYCGEILGIFVQSNMGVDTFGTREVVRQKLVRNFQCGHVVDVFGKSTSSRAPPASAR